MGVFSVEGSEKLYHQALRYLPGAVNSPVRAFKGVGGTPIFFKKAQGAYLFDVDGNRYIDYVGSWGPMIVGHGHPDVIERLQATLREGISFGAPCELEVQLAEKIVTLMPAIERLRMVSSGTEATMTAIRLARGFTGKNKVIKFEGCYHGHADSLLVKAGSGALTLGVPSSSGVPASVALDTLVATFNDTASVDECIALAPNDIACIIVEPIAGNMNLVRGNPEFLAHLRKRCDEIGAVLIFDEVMTGFRVALGGAVSLYQIRPDLITLGKVVGGGLPVGVVGGKSDIMSCLAPEGSVYQAGTLSGNPLAMAGGLATLEIISQSGFFETLSSNCHNFCVRLNQIAHKMGVPFLASSVGGMFGLYFTPLSEVNHYQHVLSCDVARFKRFFHDMLSQGVYLAPSAFEAGFVSGAHTENDFSFTLAAAEKAFAR